MMLLYIIPFEKWFCSHFKGTQTDQNRLTHTIISVFSGLTIAPVCLSVCLHMRNTNLLGMRPMTFPSLCFSNMFLWHVSLTCFSNMFPCHCGATVISCIQVVQSCSHPHYSLIKRSCWKERCTTPIQIKLLLKGDVSPCGNKLNR